MDGQTGATRRVLVADDDPDVRAMLETICRRAGLLVVAIADGADVIPTIEHFRPDLVLMDALMPTMDGYTATERIRGLPEFARLPIIMLTGLSSRQDRVRGVRAGVSDFLTKPFDVEELILRVRNQLKAKEFADFLAQHNEILERRIAERTERIHESHVDAIYRLAVVSEYRDEDTGAHIRRISHYARELSLALGMGAEFGHAVFHGASMHDIGKVGVPDHILWKRGPLTDREWSIMRTHTTLGARILSGAASPYLAMGEVIARSHHERWDGSGYPSGLKAGTIPFPARIVAIVDQYDALRSVRPYKPAVSHTEAVRVISEGDGRTLPGHFDPEVRATFIAITDRMDEIHAGVTEDRLATEAIDPLAALRAELVASVGPATA